MEEKEQLTEQEQREFEDLCKKLSDYIDRINDPDQPHQEENIYDSGS